MRHMNHIFRALTYYGVCQMILSMNLDQIYGRLMGRTHDTQKLLL